MRRWVQVVVALVAIIAAFYILIPLLGGILLLISGARGTARHDELVRSAQLFGKGRTAEACITEALARADKCRGGLCDVEAQDFLAWSLNQAGDRNVFCKSIQGSVSAQDQWVEDQCRRRGRAAQGNCLTAMRGALVGCPSNPP
jgi:hypothetical protein